MDLSNESVIHVRKNNIEYLQFRKLLNYKDIITHAYSLGRNVNFKTSTLNGVLPEKYYIKAMEDYKNFCDNIGCDYKNLIKGVQKHTNNVKVVSEKINIDEPDINLKEYENIDGLITNKPNLILCSTSADCISLLFFDPIKKVIANVHSGWKGTLQRIAIKTIEKMEGSFGCKPSDIIVCICPSIRKCNFEVKKDVKDMFENEFKDLGKSNLEKIIEENTEKNKWTIDTVLINKLILKKAGLKDENIIDSKICTMCNPKYLHSYREEKENYGLNTALISIKETK